MSFDLSFYQRRFNRVFTQKLNQFKLYSTHLVAALHYSALAKGKRLRPILSYLTAQSLLPDLPLAKIDSSACALECIHIYSLIHDDLPAVDNDDIRHHQPSCHIKYGQDMAILAGDALQSMAFLLISEDGQLSDSQRIALLQVLSQQALKMVDGQALDLTSHQVRVSQVELATICKYKTGALLSCAVKIGAIIANADDGVLEKLSLFSQYLGLAYQVQDDVLDVISTQNILGKAQGSDAQNNKITHVSLLGMEKSRQLFQQYYEQARAVLLSLDLANDQLIMLVNHLKQRDF